MMITSWGVGTLRHVIIVVFTGLLQELPASYEPP